MVRKLSPKPPERDATVIAWIALILAVASCYWHAQNRMAAASGKGAGDLAKVFSDHFKDTGWKKPVEDAPHKATIPNHVFRDLLVNGFENDEGAERVLRQYLTVSEVSDHFKEMEKEGDVDTLQKMHAEMDAYISESLGRQERSVSKPEEANCAKCGDPLVLSDGVYSRGQQHFHQSCWYGAGRAMG